MKLSPPSSKTAVTRTPARPNGAAGPATSNGKPSGSTKAPFLTVKQLAARWQISVRQVHRIIADGDLRVHRFGRSIRIAIEDIELFEFRNRGRCGSPPDIP